MCWKCGLYLCKCENESPSRYRFSMPDPIVPRYDPPKIEFNLPKMEPMRFEPLPRPPTDPVRDIGGRLVGQHDPISNQLFPLGGGPAYNVIGPNRLVTDPMGNTVGQLGPCGTLFGHPFPELFK